MPIIIQLLGIKIIHSIYYRHEHTDKYEITMLEACKEYECIAMLSIVFLVLLLEWAKLLFHE